MALTFCFDVTAADWIARSDLPWQRLVGFGPGGFDAYARLRLLPDPAWPGQSENEAEGDWRIDQPSLLFDALAKATSTPEDCYFCVWEGLSTIGGGVVKDPGPVYVDEDAPAGLHWSPDAHPAVAPRVSASRRSLPKVEVPNRAYFLFRGPLVDLGGWDTARDLPAECRLGDAEAAYVWPADRAWCTARDVDQHWVGVGANREVINRLVADPRLDVVPADPREEQPYYQ